MVSNTRGQRVHDRIAALGITKKELAARAGVDRGTLDRALEDDPKVSDRTWAKVEGTLDGLEHEIGMAEAGHIVHSTIDYKGAKVTMEGSPEDVARVLREILG